jgi:hypothetical protein
MDSKSHITVHTNLYELINNFVELYNKSILHTTYCVFCIWLNSYFYSLCDSTDNNNFHQIHQDYLDVSTLYYYFYIGIGLILGFFVKPKISNGLKEQIDKIDGMYTLLIGLELTIQGLLYYVHLFASPSMYHNLNSNSNADILVTGLLLLNSINLLTIVIVFIGLIFFASIVCASLLTWIFNICKYICMSIKFTYKKIPSPDEIDKNI